MSRPRMGLKAVAVIGTAGFTFGLAGCASQMQRREFDIELEKLREGLRAEMQAGDDQLAAALGDRLTTLESDLQSLQEDFAAGISREGGQSGSRSRSTSISTRRRFVTRTSRYWIASPR